MVKGSSLPIAQRRPLCAWARCNGQHTPCHILEPLHVGRRPPAAHHDHAGRSMLSRPARRESWRARVNEGAAVRLTVARLLAAELREPRVRFLEDEVARFAGKPLADTVAELRQVITSPLGAEAGRRLHVLVSYLYHHC